MSKRDNEVEAEVLIEYASSTYKAPYLALSVLDKCIEGKELNASESAVAKIIEGRTSYIHFETMGDPDVERGDWDMPIIMGISISKTVTVNDEQNLVLLREFVDEKLNNTSQKITTILEKRQKGWRCLECSRYLGKDLSSVEEVKTFLRDFAIGKYRKCRSCNTLNYFEIRDKELVFKAVDKLQVEA